MRVAHVNNFNPDANNGISQTVVGTVRTLIGLGVEVEMWHFTPDVRDVVERQREGVPIFDLPCARGPVIGANWLPAASRRFLSARRDAVDLIHMHSVFRNENLWGARLGIPYVVTPQNGYNTRVIQGRNRMAKRLWSALYERKLVNRAARVIAVAPPERDDFDLYGVGAPVRLIPNGIDPAALDRPSRPPGDSDYLLYLGRLDVHVKGLDLLLQGYADYLRARPAGAPRLVLAGADFRHGEAELRSLAETLGIAGAVQFTGPVSSDEKWSLFGGARAFLHPSRWEGLPNAVLEALAMGRPVIVTPNTNMGDVVTGYRAGLIAGESADGVARALDLLGGSTAAELDAMGGRARALISENYTWPSIGRRIVELYREVLGEAAPEREIAPALSAP